MKNPHITFLTNKNLDKWKIYDFLNRQWLKETFQEMIYKTHPELKGVSKKQKMNKYIDDYYNNRMKKPEALTNYMQKEWDKISRKFFINTNKIYKNTPWPKGEYKAFLSISPPYPRFLDTKTFQVGLPKNDRWKQTVAHEMNHFIFYEYIRLRYTPQLDNTIEHKMNKLLKNKFKIPLWELSEVHVAIVLNSNPYKGHEKHYALAQKLWKNSNQDINKFFTSLEKK